MENSICCFAAMNDRKQRNPFMNQNITQNKNCSSGKAARAALQASDAVLFDLDGTLVDSMWMWKEIDIEYLGRFDLSTAS